MGRNSLCWINYGLNIIIFDTISQLKSNLYVSLKTDFSDEISSILLI